MNDEEINGHFCILQLNISKSEIVPVCKFPIHYSILSSAADLVKIDYIYSVKDNTFDIIIITKSGVFVSQNNKQSKINQISETRSKIYAEYREKKLKMLKHIDSHAEKAGIFGRIFSK